MLDVEKVKLPLFLLLSWLLSISVILLLSSSLSLLLSILSSLSNSHSISLLFDVYSLLFSILLIFFLWLIETGEDNIPYILLFGAVRGVMGEMGEGGIATISSKLLKFCISKPSSCSIIWFSVVGSISPRTLPPSSILLLLLFFNVLLTLVAELLVVELSNKHRLHRLVRPDLTIIDQTQSRLPRNQGWVYSHSILVR